MGIRVFVVDDHPIVLDGARLVIEDATDLELAGTATSVSEALTAIHRNRADILLLDARLGSDDPVWLIRRLIAIEPHPFVLMFTADPSSPIIAKAIAAGARGVVSKDEGGVALVEAILAVSRGELRMIPTKTSSDYSEKQPILTPREVEVLRLVTTGKTNPEIALQLGLTFNTVKTYWQTTMQKLGVRNRVEAVGVAHRLGFLEDLPAPSPNGRTELRD